MGGKTGNGRILIMDDDKMMRLIAVFLLNKLGYEAEAVANGEEAVELYQRERDEGKPFDAVILDIRVGGGMGGGEAVQHLHRIDPEAKVVISSGSHNDPLMRDFARYGFRNALPKPYGAADLGKVLSAILSGDSLDSFDATSRDMQSSPFAIS